MLGGAGVYTHGTVSKLFTSAVYLISRSLSGIVLRLAEGIFVKGSGP